ncbi:MAG: hypothetical protein AAB036_07005 [Elusimicrobiota bacterium]
MDGLELIYDFFEDRPHASALIRQRAPAALGLLGALLGATALFFAHALADRSALPFGWPALALSWLWQAAVTFTTTALLHLILELGGQRGSARSLFVHLGLSELAWLAAVPAVLLCQAAFEKPVWGLRLVFFSIGLWSLALKARGIRDEYGVGGGWAWLTLGVPYLAGIVFVLLATFLAALGFILPALSAWTS